MMNQKILIVIITIILAIGGFFIFKNSELVEEKETNPVSALPWLHAEGNRIATEDGTLTILRGAAIEDPAISPREVFFGAKEEDIETFAEWNFNLIRIPVHPENYKNDPDYLKKYIDKIVKTASKKGIYVLLGWHGHGNPFTGEVEQGKDGLPITLWQADMELTKDFWTEASQRYANNPAVIYSIYNEPAFMTWDEWKVGAEEIIDVIRMYDSKKIIFVSGVEWGADLREVGGNPIDSENIVYEAHPYPSVYWRANPNDPSKADNITVWDEYFGYLTYEYPVFVGEWGYQTDSNNKEEQAIAVYATTEDYGRPLMDYMTEKGISWSAWVWSDLWYPPMLKNRDYEATEFGELVKNELAINISRLAPNLNDFG